MGMYTEQMYGCNTTKNQKKNTHDEMAGTYIPPVLEEFMDKIYELRLIQHFAMNVLELILAVKSIQDVLEKFLHVRIARH